MPLTAQLLILALLLLVFGVSLLAAPMRVLPKLRLGLRSPLLATVLLIVGGVWFIRHVMHLGEADFGAYRWLIAGLAAGIGISAFKHAPDFLAVRAGTIVYLLAADHFLAANFMRYEPGLLFAKGIVYAGIFVSLWWAVSPFRARDLLEWVSNPAKSWRVRVTGGVCAALGLAVSAVALTLE